MTTDTLTTLLLDPFLTVGEAERESEATKHDAPRGASVRPVPFVRRRTAAARGYNAPASPEGHTWHAPRTRRTPRSHSG
jgi:hypothetical protein